MSILFVFVNSQGLALKAYGAEVRAPTGHKSIILPDNSPPNPLGELDMISISSPLPIAPKS